MAERVVPGRPFEPIWARGTVQRGRRSQLTLEAIVAAAMRIADADGLDAVSIRRVAAELRARTMTLYSHIVRKEDIFDLMSDALVMEVLVPDGELPADWREAISMITRRERAAILLHPWAVDLIGRKTSVGPNTIRYIEQALAALDGLGADGATVAQIVGAARQFMLGFVIQEIRDREMVRRLGYGHAEVKEAMRPYLRSIAAGGNFPRVTALIESGPGFGRDEAGFERGLRWLLDGIERDVLGH